jgi:hypothetical protein
MPADVITQRVVAVCLVGEALSHLTTIRNSTLPGTALSDACEHAIAGVEQVIGVLYAPDRSTA